MKYDIKTIDIETKRSNNLGFFSLKVTIGDDYGRKAILYDQQIMIGDTIHMSFKETDGSINLADKFKEGQN